MFDVARNDAKLLLHPEQQGDCHLERAEISVGDCLRNRGRLAGQVFQVRNAGLQLPKLVQMTFGKDRDVDPCV